MGNKLDRCHLHTATRHWAPRQIVALHSAGMPEGLRLQVDETRWRQQEAQLRGEVALLEDSVRRLEAANADLQTASSEHMQPLHR